MLLVGDRLEIEYIVALNDLAQGFVLRLLLVLLNLTEKWLAFVIWCKRNIIIGPHDYHRLLCFKRLFSQMPTLVVEKAVRVAAPCYTLHQDPKLERISYFTMLNLRMSVPVGRARLHFHVLSCLIFVHYSIVEPQCLIFVANTFVFLDVIGD